MISATIECGREATRNGLLLRVERLSGVGELEAVLRHAGVLAAEQRPELRRVGDPGFWVAYCVASAMALGFPVTVLRPGADRCELHARVVVEGSPMLSQWPAWPVARCGVRVWDLRPESILALGPSDADLRRFAAREGMIEHVSRLREMFDIGVIGWSKRPSGSGRWEVVSAISHPSC